MNILVYSFQTSQLIKKLPIPQHLVETVNTLITATNFDSVENEALGEDVYDYILSQGINESFNYTFTI
jgi:hypothetical protein